ETTGYEIRKRSTEGDFSFFLEASFGSIYPALSKLEEDGFVTSHVQAQEGKPAKRVYSITQVGRESFINSLFEDLNA
ncbi:PadR family transcriptional regulator, partial [Henriciella marina]